MKKQQLRQLKSVQVQKTKSTDMPDRDEFLTEYYRNGDANSKLQRNRLMDPTAVSCIKILAQSIGKLPAYLYNKTPSGDKRLFEHPFLKVLTRRPNDFQSLQEFLEMAVSHLCLDGNFYAIKQYRGNKLLGFLPIEYPSAVQPIIREGKLLYHLTPNPNYGLQYTGQEYTADEILHIKAPGTTLLKGQGCIEQARLSLELACVQREHSLNFAERASIPAGIISLKTEGTEIDDDAYDETVTALNDSFSGGTNSSGRLAVLPGSVEYHQLTISNADAQFLESRMFGVKEIAAIFGVPLHMLGHEQPKYSNLEQSKLSFYTDTLAPLIARIQAAFDRHLEDLDVYFALDERELTRGDSVAVSNRAMNLFKSGIITLNEARTEVGYTQMDGCDRLGMPMNNIRLGTAEELLELQLVMAMPELTQSDEGSTNTTATSPENAPTNEAINTVVEPDNNNDNEGNNEEKL